MPLQLVLIFILQLDMGDVKKALEELQAMPPPPKKAYIGPAGYQLSGD